MKTSFEAVYQCEPQFYFEQYFDAEGRKKRELEGCGTVKYNILESNREGDVWTHVAESFERMNAPAPVRKIFGETSRVEEHATWRRGTTTIDAIYIPDTLKSKISIASQLRAQDLGDGTTRVTVDLEVKAKIFAVGGMIEKMAAKEMPVHLQKDVDYFNAHIAPGAKS